MRALIGLILLALMLAGCGTKPEATLCPAPDGLLLLPPKPLPRLPDGPMSQDDAITAWLQDIELFRIQQASYRALQNHGHDQCAWPRP